MARPRTHTGPCSADDLIAVQRRVEAAGGRIAKPIFDFPGGQRFHFLDPDDYELAGLVEAVARRAGHRSVRRKGDSCAHTEAADADHVHGISVWNRRFNVSAELNEMTSIQPELWVDAPREALAFYQAAFGATIIHRVGHGDDIVAQLSVGGAAFWVATASSAMKRLSPRSIGGATSRTLLVVEDPDNVVRQAVAAGATETSPVGEEHGWRLGRIIDPFGHEWEIGTPLGSWPPG